MQNSKATIWDGFDRYHWCEEYLLTKKQQQKRLRKNVSVCYFTDSFACGFETRASPSNSLATAANFVS